MCLDFIFLFFRMLAVILVLDLFYNHVLFTCTFNVECVYFHMLKNLMGKKRRRKKQRKRFADKKHCMFIRSKLI